MSSKPIEVVILSGMSGSGKSSALNTLEDAGYFAIDNLPGALFPSLMEILRDGRRFAHLRKIALVMDAREKSFLQNFEKYFGLLKAKGIHFRTFFLDSRDDALLRRFSETRRRHPLASKGRVLLGIHRERNLLNPVRALSHHVIDTSYMTVHQLREKVLTILRGDRRKEELSVTVISFGYRFGIPLEADIVLDVRFLPNPYFVKSLRPLSGKDRAVARFILKQKVARTFLKTLRAMLSLLLREYLGEGKAYLNIAFGCTGGRHRSVTIAEEVANSLKKLGYPAKIHHRDVNREE